MVTIGSLFSGVGGLELGLERAGLGPVVWQVERQPYCRRVLAQHWPRALRYSDIRTFNHAPLVDLICGGFPCPDLSDSEGDGLDGPQSGLWFEMLRVIAYVRPRFIVIENVSNLLLRGVDRVIGGLAPLGYDAIWFPFRATDVGLPHRRQRLFIVAYADAPRCDVEQAPRLHLHGSRGDHTDGRCPGVPGPLDGAPAWQAFRESGGPEPGLRRMPHGFPSALDRARLRALGNACIPYCAEIAGWIIRDGWGL